MHWSDFYKTLVQEETHHYANIGNGLTIPQQQALGNYVRNVSNLHSNYDCSEIAEDLGRLLGVQESLVITPVNNNGFTVFTVVENGELEEYVNHYVLLVNNYVIDPRFAQIPIHVEKYLNFLQELNPQVPLTYVIELI